jgi:hypothetical protein
MIGMAMAALGGASAILDGMEGQEQTRQAIAQHGRDQAATEVNRAIAQAALVAEASKVKQQAQQASIQTEQSAAAETAQKEVQAAAAGTAGSSVDVGINQTQFNLGTVQGGIQQQQENAMQDINQQSRDIVVSTATQKKQVVSDNNHLAGLTGIFGAGLSGYLQSRG